MKIGITSIGYNCKEHLEKVFEPWQKIKEGALGNEVEVFISTAHACFIETYQCGYPNDSTDGTIEAFKRLRGKNVIDNLIKFDGPDYEFNVWNSNLPFLFNKKIDLLFMLNMDEVWEVEEIKKLLSIINQNLEADYFKINFKNYVFDYNTYVDNFIVPRVWKTDRHGGIKRFHFDDELTFKNGTVDKQALCKTIDKSDIFPKHYSWVGSKDYLQRKLKFQKEHYKLCSYSWDDGKDCLVFNDKYYEMFNKPKPMLYND